MAKPRTPTPAAEREPAPPIPTGPEPIPPHPIDDESWLQVQCSPILRNLAGITPEIASSVVYANLYELVRGRSNFVAKIDAHWQLSPDWLQRNFGGAPEGTEYLIQWLAESGKYVKQHTLMVTGTGLLRPAAPAAPSAAVAPSSGPVGPSAGAQDGGPWVSIASMVTAYLDRQAAAAREEREERARKDEEARKRETERIDAFIQSQSQQPAAQPAPAPPKAVDPFELMIRYEKLRREQLATAAAERKAIRDELERETEEEDDGDEDDDAMEKTIVRRGLDLVQKAVEEGIKD